MDKLKEIIANRNKTTLLVMSLKEIRRQNTNGYHMSRKIEESKVTMTQQYIELRISLSRKLEGKRNENKPRSFIYIYTYIHNKSEKNQHRKPTKKSIHTSEVRII